MPEIQRGIAGVQWHPRPVAWIEKTSAQSSLQEIEPHQRGIICVPVAGPLPRPVCFDLANPLYYEFVVSTVRTTMERQADTEGFPFGGGQQLAVSAKIVDGDIFNAKGADHLAQSGQLQDLTRDQMMTLLFGLVA